MVRTLQVCASVIATLTIAATAGMEKRIRIRISFMRQKTQWHKQDVSGVNKREVDCLSERAVGGAELM